MPMVHAFVGRDFATAQTRLRNTDQIGLLRQACEEVIPAGLNSTEGPLTPGSVEFISTVVTEGINLDVILSIEAYYYEDRFRDIEARAANMKDALNELFPGYTFAVFPKLVQAGWASDLDDPPFHGDMSMAAAITRTLERFEHLKFTQGDPS